MYKNVLLVEGDPTCGGGGGANLIHGGGEDSNLNMGGTCSLIMGGAHK